MQLNVFLLGIGATVSFLGGLWLTWRANRKAREPFAPVLSKADYLGIFLWILTLVLAAAAVAVSK